MRSLPLALLPGCSFVFLDEPCAVDEAWAAVGAGGLHTCGLHRDGTIECWGSDAVGQLDAPPGRFASIAVGYEHGCALDDAGAVTCWGRDDDGQVSEASTAAGLTGLTAGGGHVCALDTAGELVCWGRGDRGQLVPETATPPFAQVDAGWLHTCVLGEDGAVDCFGDPRLASDPPEPLADVTAVSAGLEHSCGIAGGAETCWGTGDDGRLDPAAVGRAVAIEAGTDTTCTLDAAGAVACTGADDVGQASPPDGVFEAISLGPGGRHGCAIEAIPDPPGYTRMACWGLDDDGQASPPRPDGAR